MLRDKMKTLLEVCEVESGVLTVLTYDEISKIYSALMAMDVYSKTLEKCLMDALDKSTVFQFENVDKKIERVKPKNIEEMCTHGCVFTTK